jgi:hypothetical protein
MTFHFFDSLHDATALLFDGVIVSLDGAYKSVQGLHALRHDEVRGYSFHYVIIKGAITTKSKGSCEKLMA